MLTHGEILAATDPENVINHMRQVQWTYNFYTSLKNEGAIDLIKGLIPHPEKSFYV